MDDVEQSIDVQWAHAIAPGANITLYTSQNTTFQSGLNLAIQRALDDNTINILNVSFGQCEAYLGQGGNQEVFNFWQQAAAQGISVTVSTGALVLSRGGGTDTGAFTIAAGAGRRWPSWDSW